MKKSDRTNIGLILNGAACININEHNLTVQNAFSIIMQIKSSFKLMLINYTTKITYTQV